MDNGFTFTGEVTAEEKAFYERNGFIVYRQFVPEGQVAALSSDAEARQQELRDGAGLADKDTVAPRSVLPNGDELWHRLNYFTEYSKAADEISRSERMSSVYRGLGGPEYWLLRDSMHGAIWQVKTGDRASKYKEIRWHQDFGEGHPLSPAFTAGLYLHDSNRSNGCLAVIPMSHRWPLRSLPRERYYVEVRAGDLICHHERLFHGSEAMRRETDFRATLYFYFCSGEVPEERRAFASDEELKSIRNLFTDGEKA